MMHAASLPARDETLLVRAGAGLFLAAAAVSAVLAPAWLWVLLVGALSAGAAFLAWRHLTAFCVCWLVLTGATLEMALYDLLGSAAFQGTIAVVKGAEVALAAVCAVRWGGRWDGFNPAWGFLAMEATGIAHGLYPGMSAAESLRSLAGWVNIF
jgi:hypothetical protein